MYKLITFEETSARIAISQAAEYWTFLKDQFLVRWKFNVDPKKKVRASIYINTEGVDINSRSAVIIQSLHHFGVNYL